MNFPLSLGKAFAVLFVRDIGRSRHFYESLLGMHVIMDFELNIVYEEGFAIWQIMPDQIIPRTLGPDDQPEGKLPRPHTEVCFETHQDIQKTYELLKAEGVDFLHPVNEEIWGQRSIRFYDPDGHLVEIGESFPVFIGRFRDQGMSAEEIAERTFTPVEGVRRILKEMESQS